MPGGRDASANIRELYQANDTKAKPRSRKQMVAIGLAEARRAGGNVPPPKNIRALPMKKGK